MLVREKEMLEEEKILEEEYVGRESDHAFLEECISYEKNIKRALQLLIYYRLKIRRDGNRLPKRPPKKRWRGHI